MAEENIIQEFKLKNIDKNYLINFKKLFKWKNKFEWIDR